MSVSWNPGEQAFAVYGVERGQTEHRVDALLVDPRGHVRPGKGFSLPADQPYRVFCHVGERLLAHGGPLLPDNVHLPPCEVVTQQGGARTCVPLDPRPARIVFCPEQLLSQHECGEAHWLSPQGLRSFDAPANTSFLLDGFPFASASGLVPVPVWFTSDQILVMPDWHSHCGARQRAGSSRPSGCCSSTCSWLPRRSWSRPRACGIYELARPAGRGAWHPWRLLSMRRSASVQRPGADWRR